MTLIQMIFQLWIHILQFILVLVPPWKQTHRVFPSMDFVSEAAGKSSEFGFVAQSEIISSVVFALNRWSCSEPCRSAQKQMMEEKEAGRSISASSRS